MFVVAQLHGGEKIHFVLCAMARLNDGTETLRTVEAVIQAVLTSRPRHGFGTVESGRPDDGTDISGIADAWGIQTISEPRLHHYFHRENSSHYPIQASLLPAHPESSPRYSLLLPDQAAVPLQ